MRSGGWFCAGLATGLDSVGSYRCFDKLGPSIIIVRSRDQELRAFYNTCRHRGAPVVRESQGRTNLLRCQYHSWSYALDGRLIGVPDEQDFGCLDKSSRGLIEVRCASWAGLIFLNLSSEGPELADYLGELPREFSTVGLNRMREVDRKSVIVDCNWKAAIDAFLEIYHVKTIHPKTVDMMLDCRAVDMALIDHGHSRMTIRRNLTQGANFREQPQAPDIAAMDDIFRRNAVAYNVFPNLIMPVDAVGFPVMLFWPRGTHQCELEAIFLGQDWGAGPRPEFWEHFLEVYCQLLDEDVQNLAGIQKSLKSGAFTGMMLSYAERRIYWFHEELDRRIGIDQVPAELRVPPLLSPYLEPTARLASGQ